jgi:hypothetical protein
MKTGIKPAPFIICILILHFSKTSAQVFPAVGTRAIGGIEAVGPKGLGAQFNNPAAVLDDSGTMLMVEYHNPFGVKGLGYQFAGLGFDGGGLRWSLSWKQLGSIHLHQRELCIGTANRISRKSTLGLGLHHLHTRIPTPYSQRANLAAQFGFTLATGARTLMGVCWYYPIVGNLSAQTGDGPPSALRAAIRHQSSDGLSLFAESKAESGLNAALVSLRAGLSYAYNRKFTLMLGTGNRQTPFSFGLGFKQHGLLVQTAFDYHLQLGFTPQITLLWQSR